MKRLLFASLAVVVAGVVAWTAWQFWPPKRQTNELTLYGNVDLREVSLAFNNNQRIASVLVHEGDRVHKGEVLARLDTSRLKPRVAAAAANLEVDRANLANARRQYQRTRNLWTVSHGAAISRQAFDNARAAYDSATAREDVNKAQLALLKQELADAVLVAPLDATVRTRILEPGDMASPQTPVFSLAITSPKWVRVYVPEPDLGKLHPRMAAYATIDGFPGRRFKGWVGFISPVAEFTPKAVETPELRTSLVYEVRVYVRDPQNDLRLGMPATVHIPFKSRNLAPPSHAAAKPAGRQLQQEGTTP